MPKKVKMYCKNCNKHTLHSIKKVSKKKRGELKMGQRRYRRISKGYGGFPRPVVRGEKPTRKHDLRYKCESCGKMWTKKGFRIKKLEFE